MQRRSYSQEPASTRRTMRPSRSGKSRVLNGVKDANGDWYTHDGQKITGWIAGTLPVVEQTNRVED